MILILPSMKNSNREFNLRALFSVPSSTSTSVPSCHTSGPITSVSLSRSPAVPLWDTIKEEEFDEGEFVELFARTATKPKAKQEKAKAPKIKVRYHLTLIQMYQR